MLPCPTQPPPNTDHSNQHIGGSRWYHIEFTRYQCPPGKEFESGMFPYWYSNCTVEKLWDPPEVEECVGKIKIEPSFCNILYQNYILQIKVFTVLYKTS